MSNRTAIIGLGCVAAAVSSSVVLVVSFVAPGPLAVATAAVAPALFIGVWFVLPFAYRRSSWSADTVLTGLWVGAREPLTMASLGRLAERGLSHRLATLTRIGGNQQRRRVRAASPPSW